MRQKLFDEMQSLKTELVDNCEHCQGTGFNGSEECRCRVIQRYLNYLIEAKIPTEYWELSLDDLTEVKPEGIIGLVEHYTDKLKVATKKSLGLMFMGPNGRGKTSLQCAIGKEAIVKGYSVQYFTAQQYIEAVKAKDTELLGEYESGQIILFDELDKVYISRTTNFVTKTLEEFLRRMISNGCAFIICTNLLETDLVSMFGESTMSMLRGHLNFITVAGSDFRETQKTDWLSRLEADVDYSNEHILDSAYNLYARELEEEDVGWRR